MCHTHVVLAHVVMCGTLVVLFSPNIWEDTLIWSTSACFNRDDASCVRKSFPTCSSCLTTGAVPLIAAPIASAVNMPSVLNVQSNLTTNQVPVSDSKQTKPKTTKTTKQRKRTPSQAVMQKKMQLQMQLQQQQQQQQQQYLPSQQPAMMFGQSTQQQQQQQQPFFQQAPQQRGLQPGAQPRLVVIVRWMLIKYKL